MLQGVKELAAAATRKISSIFQKESQAAPQPAEAERVPDALPEEYLKDGYNQAEPVKKPVVWVTTFYHR